MSHVISISLVTVREVLRRKIQVNLLFFGLALVGASYLVSGLTLGEGYRILSDFGLSAMQLIGLLVAIFVGSNLVTGDMERRVLQPILAKPISRSGYLLGRYLGLSIVLVLNLAVMAGLFALILVSSAGNLQPLGRAFFEAVVLQGVQFLVIGAVAILFSAITSPTLAAIFTLAVAVSGLMTGELRALWKGPGTWIPRLLWYLLPNLSALSANESLVYRLPPPAQAWTAVLYGAAYAGAALALAGLVFERRDLR